MFENQEFTVIAVMTKTGRGPARRRWRAEVCDPACSLAGLTAYGPFPRLAKIALARAVWAALRDGSAGIDVRQVRDAIVVSWTEERFGPVQEHVDVPA